ncbi:MAG: DUF935 domain-containing protein, partial [Polyangiales bacterium]
DIASSLNPKGLAGLFRAADEGDVESYLILAEQIEERELHYRSVISKRKLAASGAPVHVEPASDAPEHKEHAEAVREDIVDRPQFRDLLFDLADAIGKGYSLCETIWDTSGKRWKPRAYKWREQRHFVWDQQTLSMLRLLDEQEMVNGVDLPPFKFIVHVPKLKSGHPIRGGLARLGAVAYMLKSFTVRDWHTFMEIFGMPIRVGRYDTGATKDEKKELKKAVTQIAHDAAGIMPKTMEVEFVQAMQVSGGDKLFSGAAEWWDRQVSKLVLGQTMTTEDGSSRSQAEVHQDDQRMLTAADDRQLSATINRDLTRPYIALNFGEQEMYPRIVVKPDEPEDLSRKSQTVKTLAGAGLPIPMRWAYESFGIPEPEQGEAVMVPVSARQPSPAGEGGDDQGGDGVDDGAQNRQLAHRVAELEHALNREARTKDTIDRIAEEHLQRWEPMLQGTVGRLIEMAQNAGSFEELEVLLEDDSSLTVDEATRELAVALFKARGLGDASDDPNR